jgi:hypothetical protein
MGLAREIAVVFGLPDSGSQNIGSVLILFPHLPLWWFSEVWLGLRQLSLLFWHLVLAS